MYTPICIENYSRPVKACKSVCQRVRMGCENFMQKYGFDWPEFMNCDLFPDYGSVNDVCMDPIDATVDQQGTTNQPESLVESKTNSKPSKSLCQKPYMQSLKSIQTHKPHDLQSDNCIQQPCYNDQFTNNERTFSHFWIVFLAISCFLSSSLTAITYLIERARFKYPERPIIYLCMCYVCISSGYLLRFILFNSENTTCEVDGSLKAWPLMGSNSSCALIFVLVYYFTIASAMWWIVVAFTWFLAAGLKWGIEAITKYNHYFHLFAWLVPSLATITVLGLGLIDRDPISGICSVGNANTQNMHLFVIAPLLVTLLVGIGFLLLGFVALFRLRNTIKQQQHEQRMHFNTNRLENLMLRIGVFAVLYTVPTTCLIACNLYEQHYRVEWENSLICKQNEVLLNVQLTSDHPCFLYSMDKTEARKKPEFAIFMIKYLSCMTIGILSGFWIWTHKTLCSWKYFVQHVLCFYCKRQEIREKANIYFQANKSPIQVDSTDSPHNVYHFTAVAQHHPSEQELDYYNIAVNDQHDSSVCHTNKAVFYYDFSSSSCKTDKLTNTTKLSTTTTSS
jgi:frizzled protein 5/8